MLLTLAACEGDGPDKTSADVGADGMAPGNADASTDPSSDAIAMDATSCPVDSNLPCPPPEYATWPMPNPQSLPLPNPGSFDVKNSTATDRITGLQWQRSHTDKRDWQNALDTCATLSLEGYDDWRLPSRIELVSIVDFTRQPSTDNTAFADTALDYFWSSSTVSFDPKLAYSVYFGAGLTAYGMKTGASAHVRCVRGGRPGVLPRYTISPTEVVDRNTGLVWQRQVSGESLSFATANLLCNESTIGGHSDWRLPSAKEMQTIVEERLASPMVDPVVFPDTPGGRYWTGSTAGGTSSTNAVYFEIADGTTEHAAAGEPFHVRCVR